MGGLSPKHAAKSRISKSRISNLPYECCSNNGRCDWWSTDALSSVLRRLEGSGRPYHHDRNPDRSAVVHLRLRQGLLPPAAAPSPRDARVAEEEAGPDGVKALPFTQTRARTHSRVLYL